MTDELSIQPQVIQKKTDYSPLWGAAGAVGGAAAGYGINKAITKPMSHEDIIAEVNDKDKFDARTKEGAKEASSWKDVKAQADVVAEKRAELEKVSKGTLTSNATEQVEFNAAEKAKNDAYTRLFNSKKAELEGTGSVEIDPAKFKKFDEIPLSELPTEDVKSQKPFRGDQLKNKYNNLTTEVRNAQQALDNSLNTGLRRDKKVVTDAIEANFRDAYNDLAGKTPEQISSYFAEKETGSWWSTTKTKSTQYARVFNIAQQQYPIPTTLTDEQFLSIGKELAPGEKAPSGWTSQSVKYTAENGRIGYKTIYFDPNEASKLLNSEKERVKALQEAVADQIFAETQKAVQIKKDIASLPQKVAKEVSLENAKATGLYTPASATQADSLNMTEIIDGATRKRNTYNNLEGYAADIQLLNAKKKAGETTVNGIVTNADIAQGTSIDDAIKQIQARNKAYKPYKKQLKTLQSSLDESIKANQIVQEFDSKILEELNGNKRLIKAKNALAEQFPQLFGGGKTSGLTADEIKAQAEKYATEHKEYKDLLKIFEDKKSILDKAISEKGTVDEGAKKVAQEALDAAEKSLKEKAESLGKKFFKGGINPWVAGTIGAAVLGITAFGVSKKSNS